MFSSGLQSAHRLFCRHIYMNAFGWRSSSSFEEVRFVISLSIWMVLKLKCRKMCDVLKVWYILQSTPTQAFPPSLMKWVVMWICVDALTKVPQNQVGIYWLKSVHVLSWWRVQYTESNTNMFLFKSPKKTMKLFLTNAFIIIIIKKKKRSYVCNV